ncbi:hypothetical protein MPTK1_2g14780 [Marchantia polymorpha subsp. ruderalis]|uniref:Phytocyanin domain-containing protein n=2 Tax=Marchantia polymorpha TaxID=3197 RepID=A0A176WCK3_MARPO|nr:hypothetical protein AXG93_4174s1000 [Marchantia polymorpha subsp. ruderalis]PTQ40065.1 hypothetical protein MARPO_0042s0100 [Marchantia polymorpha]BAV53360.1 uclacyanin 1 [Marchantia polymorpha]BBN02370.1 hypothetical protein Mp_2g14780 [Marchantia polymorpha subsp. ruderalis]|eukprot:PTQ40065.1 hypothetical protein MARPO_0042s0100 [Marchantia polymorpha]
MASMQQAIFTVLIIASGLYQDAEAVTHIVGGATGPGWTFQANDLTFYDTWASKESFNVGDVLVFNFNSTLHDVLEVSTDDLKTCTTPASPIQRNLTSNGSLTISTSGTHAYICGVPQHCTFGMKMTITTVGASTPNTNSTNPAGSKAAVGAIKSPFFTFNLLLGVMLTAIAVATV